jgi:hypothetical protein
MSEVAVGANSHSVITPRVSAIIILNHYYDYGYDYYLVEHGIMLIQLHTHKSNNANLLITVY